MMKQVFIAIIYATIIGIIQPSFAATVTLMAKLNGAKHPSIVGTTNLPEGTKLATDFVCPLKYCKAFSSFESTATVHGGIFVSEPLQTNGYEIPKDGYGLNVVVLSEIGGQSPEVISKLKAFGWNGSTPISFHFDSPPPSNDGSLSQITNQEWTDIGTNGSIRFSYGTNAEFDNMGHAHVAVRTITPLASGEEKLHIDIGILPCGKDGSLPRNFAHETSVDLIVQPDGFAQVDPSAMGPAGQIPYAIAIEKGSVLDVVAQKVCRTH